MIKVSVIVALWKSQHLERLMDSLSRQSLPASEFEVVLVDDGSPDDTFARACRYATVWPNVQAHQIEHSGWPSLPRNVGIKAARGEYVVFADHDDSFYPDALRAAYEFAKANNSDVVNGKECRTNDMSWGIGTYSHNAAQAKGAYLVSGLTTSTMSCLSPLNPHKLYRRSLLIEHGIQFPEEPDKLWYEDQFFNIAVMRCAKTVSTMASTPFYYWCTNAGSTSSVMRPATDMYWVAFRNICKTIETRFADADDPRDVAERDALLRDTYRIRIVDVFDNFWKHTSEEFTDYFERALKLRERFNLGRFDEQLRVHSRYRATLLGLNESAALRAVVNCDRTPVAFGEATALKWVNGVLNVQAAMMWESSRDSYATLKRVDDKVVRELPAEALAVLPEGINDVTQAFGSIQGAIAYRDRDSRVTGLLPSSSQPPFDAACGADGWPQLHVEASFDPRTGNWGEEMPNGIYDLALQCTGDHGSTRRRLRSSLPDSYAAIVGDRLCVAYTTTDGFAAVHLAPGPQRASTILKTSQMRVECLNSKDGSTCRVIIRLIDRVIPNEGIVHIPIRIRAVSRRPVKNDTKAVSDSGSGGEGVSWWARAFIGIRLLVSRCWRPRKAKSSTKEVRALLTSRADGKAYLSFELPGDWASVQVCLAAPVDAQDDDMNRWYLLERKSLALSPLPGLHRLRHTVFGWIASKKA